LLFVFRYATLKILHIETCGVTRENHGDQEEVQLGLQLHGTAIKLLVPHMTQSSHYIPHITWPHIQTVTHYMAPIYHVPHIAWLPLSMGPIMQGPTFVIYYMAPIYEGVSKSFQTVH